MSVYVCICVSVYVCLYMCVCICGSNVKSLDQFSPLIDRVVGGHEGRVSKDPPPVFSTGDRCG